MKLIITLLLALFICDVTVADDTFDVIFKHFEELKEMIDERKAIAQRYHAKKHLKESSKTEVQKESEEQVAQGHIYIGRKWKQLAHYQLLVTGQLQLVNSTAAPQDFSAPPSSSHLFVLDLFFNDFFKEINVTMGWVPRLGKQDAFRSRVTKAYFTMVHDKHHLFNSTFQNITGLLKKRSDLLKAYHSDISQEFAKWEDAEAKRRFLRQKWSTNLLEKMKQSSETFNKNEASWEPKKTYSITEYEKGIRKSQDEFVKEMGAFLKGTQEWLVTKPKAKKRKERPLQIAKIQDAYEVKFKQVRKEFKQLLRHIKNQGFKILKTYKHRVKWSFKKFITYP